MSTREGETKNSNTTDIGTFVLKYQRLVELLSPVFTAFDAILYIVRWQNYILSLALLVVLCSLVYYPAVLFSCLTLSSIAAMGVGRYYSQGKAMLAQRLETPVVEQLAQEQQILKRIHKEQKTSHKVLVEYRQLLRNSENFIATSINLLEHLYSIVLWKSSEVSLCVTVLLCVLLVLFCTIHLRTIAVCVPVMVLCLNRHFFKRTVEMWKILWIYAWDSMKWLRLRKKKANEEKSNGRESTVLESGSSSEDSGKDLSSDEASQEEGQAIAVAEVPSSGTPGNPSVEEVEPFGPRLRTERRNSSDPAGATIGALTGTENDGLSSDQRTALSKKGLCSKCNASFANLLKRRHDCNYCGQTFCGSCTVKVKRSLLGATSPAAFEESVRVCLDCKAQLDDLLSINQNTSAV